MTDEIKNLKNSLTRLAYWEKLANQALDAYEADPMNPDREEAMEKFYELEFNEYVHAAHLLERFSGIDDKTARTMIRTKRDEVLAILNQTA